MAGIRALAGGRVLRDFSGDLGFFAMTDDDVAAEIVSAG